MNIFLENMLKRYPVLEKCSENIEKTFELCCKAFSNDGTLFLCGNGEALLMQIIFPENF